MVLKYINEGKSLRKTRVIFEPVFAKAVTIAAWFSTIFDKCTQFLPKCKNKRTGVKKARINAGYRETFVSDVKEN